VIQGEPYGEQPVPPRRGRRDNGLDAVCFVPLLDVDPRVGEHLLEVLRVAGVPAYLEPALDVEPYTRATSTPSPPTDRLWVDRERQEEARGIVAAQAIAEVWSRPHEDSPSQGLADPAEELAWQEIIAGFDRDPTTPEVPWPVAEDADSDVDRAARQTGTPASGTTDTATAQAEVEPPEPRPAQPKPVEDDEHFVPPPPPPVPRPPRQVVLALLLIMVGALLLLLPERLGFGPDAALALGVLSLLSAAGLLVYRLRDDRHDGPGDGAVL
jgi:hypothetical protein